MAEQVRMAAVDTRASHAQCIFRARVSALPNYHILKCFDSLSPCAW